MTSLLATNLLTYRSNKDPAYSPLLNIELIPFTEYLSRKGHTFHVQVLFSNCTLNEPHKKAFLRTRDVRGAGFGRHDPQW